MKNIQREKISFSNKRNRTVERVTVQWSSDTAGFPSSSSLLLFEQVAETLIIPTQHEQMNDDRRMLQIFPSSSSFPLSDCWLTDRPKNDKD